MGGAWCPKPMISQFSYEFLQIDLGKLAVITMVEIQGRFGNGQVIKDWNSNEAAKVNDKSSENKVIEE